MTSPSSRWCLSDLAEAGESSQLVGERVACGGNCHSAAYTCVMKVVVVSVVMPLAALAVFLVPALQEGFQAVLGGAIDLIADPLLDRLGESGPE